MSGANGTLFKSTDNGATWPQATTGIEDINGSAQNITSIAFKNASEGYLAGSGGLMMKSINGGGAWSIIPGGEIPVAVIDGVGSDGKRSFVFFGLPLHLLNGNPKNLSPSPMQQFFKIVLKTEFGL